jgi:glycerophosphoryl diester phosphodiesterase
MKPLVIGHRGAAAYALENTARSFQKAIEIGVDLIEFDVRESLDGYFIIIHDNHSGRISPRRYLVSKTHSTILKAIDLYENQKLLTLQEAFEMIPTSIGLMVEVKSIKSISKMIHLLEAQASTRLLMLTSFDLTLLSEFGKQSTKIPLGAVSKSPANILKAARMGIPFSNVCLDFQSITPKVISSWHQQNLRVFAWTVDCDKDIKGVLELRVDGIISNKPDLVKRIVSKIGGEN